MATASGLQTMPTDSSLPVGIFDSGVGGLSVLRHIHTLLPAEDLLYFADSGYAPYGDKTPEAVTSRALAITEFLLSRGAKALVIACNTATAVAAATIRQRYPGLPVIGMEPGLKPAAKISNSHIVGVLATHGTLVSTKYQALQERLATEMSTRFLAQHCIGLADQVEKGELSSPHTMRLVQQYVLPLLAEGADTLVLGCTHYPFLRPLIESVVTQTGKTVNIIDTGEAIARHLSHILHTGNKLSSSATGGQVTGFTTGSTSTLSTAFMRLLGKDIPITRISQ